VFYWQDLDSAGLVGRSVSSLAAEEYTPLSRDIQSGTPHTEKQSSTTCFGYSERPDTGLRQVSGIARVRITRKPGVAGMQATNAEKMVGDTGIEPVTPAV